jgi:uncharacterized membrane protein
MSKHIRWLHEELAKWENKGVVDGETAGKIREQYPEPGKALPWGAIIFSSIGAVIFGLGIILLFAYNWADMPKFAKLAIVFTALGLAHGFAIWLRRKGGGHPEIGEALHVLGTILFGAGMWLIGQIYHIEDHYSNTLFAWGGAALIMAWALPSMAHGVIAAILFVLWSGFEVFDFHNQAYLQPWLILIGLGGLTWHLRSRVLLIATNVGFHLTLAFAIVRADDDLVFPALFCASAIFVALGHLLRGRIVEPFRPGHFTVLGQIVVWGMIYILTFHDVAEELLVPIGWWSKDIGMAYYVVLALTVAAVALWLRVFLPVGALQKRIGNGMRWDHFIVPAALVLCVLSWIGLDFGAVGDGLLGTVLFNAIYLAGAVALMIHGCRSVRAGLVTMGSLLLALLCMTRYVDLFTSLLARSVVFLLVGAGIFVIGIIYSKAKKQLAQPQSVLPA